MLHLHTLGFPRLVGAPEGMLSTPRKEVVLLAYLARRPRRTATRSALMALLWEDRDEARARQSLRQALSELRRVVGPGLVVADDHVSLADAAVEVDADAFERAVAEGRWRDAAEAWEGDFLASAEEVGGESFRAWLEAERERLRRLASRAFDGSAAEAAERGDWAAAAAWTERWTAALPHDLAAHPRLVEALALAGRGAEASARFAELVSRTRGDLGLEPSAEFLAVGHRLRVAHERHAPPRPGSAALFSPDFVGRERQLAELDALWSRLSNGETRVVVVEGEPGIGKTRFVDELVRRLGAGPCPPFLLGARGRRTAPPSPFAGLRALLGDIHLAPGVGGASPGALAAIARHAPALQARFPELSQAPGVDGEADRRALTEVLEAVGEERPLLVVLDDAGGLDPESVDLVARAAATLRAPAIVLATARPGEAAGLAAVPGAVRLRVQPLGERELERMLASMLALPADDRHRLAVRLHAASGGNPLHAIEVLAALVDEALVAPAEDGTWRAAGAEGWPLPSGLREAVALRLDRLGAEARDVLDAAAVLRSGLDPQVLGAMTGLPEPRLAAAMEELIGRRLLRAPISGTPEFPHEFTARVAYDRLPPVRRAELHDRAAAALAARRPRDPEAAALVEYHRGRGGRRQERTRRRRVAALATGTFVGAALLAAGYHFLRPTTDAQPPRALVAAFDNRTGDPALDAVGDMAADWVTQGLAQTGLVPIVDPRSARVAETLVRAGPAALNAEARVRALARETGAGTVVWGAYYRSADTLVVQARISDAARGEVLRVLDPIRVPLDQPLRAIEQLRERTAGAFALLYNRWGSGWVESARRPPTFVAYQSFLEGMDDHVQYRYDEALTAYRRARAQDSTYVQPLLWSALVFWSLGRYPEVDSVLGLAEQTPEGLGAFDRQMLANARAELRGDWRAARTAAEEMARIAPGSEAWVIVGQEELKLHRPRHALAAFLRAEPERGWLRGWEGYWGFVAACYHSLGQYEDALRAAREARRRFPSSVYQLDYEVRQLAALGLVDSIRPRLEESLTLPPGLWPRGSLHLAAAEELAAHDRPAEARRVVDEGLAVTADDSSNRTPAALALRAELLYRGERWDELARLVQPLAQRDSTQPGWQGYLGVLSARRGDGPAAGRAAEALSRGRFPYSYGAPEFWRARIAALLGEKPQAVALLRESIAHGLVFDDRLHLESDFSGLAEFEPYRELIRTTE